MERVRGQANIPMTPEGEAQVRQSASNLVRLGGLDAMWHSNLNRAKKVAHITTERMPSVVPQDFGDALLPWNLGDFQGKPVSDVGEKINYYVYHPDEVVPSGESFNQFKQRFLPAFRGAMNQGKTKKIGLAAHGRTDALASAYVYAGMPEDDQLVIAVMFQKVPTGSVLYVAPDLSMGRITDQSTYSLQPGVYLIRHGATAWNGQVDDQASNNMTS